MDEGRDAVLKMSLCMPDNKIPVFVLSSQNRARPSPSRQSPLGNMNGPEEWPQRADVKGTLTNRYPNYRCLLSLRFTLPWERAVSGWAVCHCYSSSSSNLGRQKSKSGRQHQLTERDTRFPQGLLSLCAEETTPMSGTVEKTNEWPLSSSHALNLFGLIFQLIVRRPEVSTGLDGERERDERRQRIHTRESSMRRRIHVQAG